MPVTWSCHVCDQERPDVCISVYKRDDSAAFGQPPGTVVQNIRYCNDRTECMAGAPDARKPQVKTGGEPEQYMEVKNS